MDIDLQRPFFLNQYLAQFDWILFMNTATFINCNTDIRHIIEYHKEYHNGNVKEINNDLSFIINGYGQANNSIIHSNVWLLKNNDWSHRFLTDWIYIIQNSDESTDIQKFGIVQDTNKYAVAMDNVIFNRFFQYHSKNSFEDESEC